MLSQNVWLREGPLRGERPLRAQTVLAARRLERGRTGVGGCGTRPEGHYRAAPGVVIGTLPGVLVGGRAGPLLGGFPGGLVGGIPGELFGGTPGGLFGGVPGRLFDGVPGGLGLLGGLYCELPGGWLGTPWTGGTLALGGPGVL